MSVSLGKCAPVSKVMWKDRVAQEKGVTKHVTKLRLFCSGRNLSLGLEKNMYGTVMVVV